jgi:outer membrane immunogenic protein
VFCPQHPVVPGSVLRDKALFGSLSYGIISPLVGVQMKSAFSIRAALLSSVGVVALSGMALAADLPIRQVAPVFAPQFSWAGAYVGGHIGAARQLARWDDFNQGSLVPGGGPGSAAGCLGGCGSNLANDVGFIGGGQIGYNWQSGSFVYGIEADISGLDAKLDTDWSPNRGNLNLSTSHSIDWLATIRGRAGLAVDRTLVYLTAGVAFAGVKNAANAVCQPPGLGRRCTSDDNFSLTNDETRVGWTVGGGIEHALTQNWTVRGEALYVDLGQSDRVLVTSRDGYTFSGRFANEIVIARAGFNYKW